MTEDRTLGKLADDLCAAGAHLLEDGHHREADRVLDAAKLILELRDYTRQTWWQRMIGSRT